MSKKSDLGGALFDMLNSMTRAQGRVYRAGGSAGDALRAAKIAAARHKPIVLSKIVRPSERKQP